MNELLAKGEKKGEMIRGGGLQGLGEALSYFVYVLYTAAKKH